MRYYGGKEKLLNFIGSEVARLDLPESPSFCDLFSGTAVVGRHFKQAGFRVMANDYLLFAKCLATCRVKLNSKPKFKKLNQDPIDFLNNLGGVSGFFSDSYSPEGKAARQYFTIENARRIEAIRSQIHIWKSEKTISSDENDYLISSLLEAMNRTSNVSGTYAAYLKTWDPRSLNALTLEEPLITPGIGRHSIFNKDATDLAQELSCDVLYLDPPYNSRQYSSNYFLLDVVANGWFSVLPEVNGLTGMRDNSLLKSDFCSKRGAESSLNRIISSANAKTIILSYNNEGIIPHQAIIEMMRKHGTVQVSEFSHRRYKAINHDPTQRNTTEYLFILKKRCE